MIIQDDTELLKLEKYLVRNGRTEFVEEMRQGGSALRLAKRNSLAKHAQAIIDTEQSDQELNALKDRVKAMKAPYNDQKRMNKKLQRYLHLLMKEEGDDIYEETEE